MSVIDNFEGGVVTVEFPTTISSPYPAKMKISVSDVFRQEGLTTDPNPHFILMLSLWLPNVRAENKWIPVAVLTDDIPAQVYGLALLVGTPVYLRDYPVHNFFVYPRSTRKITIRRTRRSLEMRWAGVQAIDLQLNRLPNYHPYYTETDQSFRLTPFTLKFAGDGDTYEPPPLTVDMPIGMGYSMTQTSTNQSAHVDFRYRYGSVTRTLRFDGELLFRGTRVFSYPPSPINIPTQPPGW